MTASFASQGSSVPDNLLAGAHPHINSRKVTLISGQNLTRGAVLGRITTGGKYNLSLSAAGDGSEVPRAILAQDCDASGGDEECLIYETGDFNEDALTIGTAHTADSIRDGLRALGIFMHKNIA